MEKNAEQAFLRKMIKSYFFPKFQSAHMNWHKCNDHNCNKVSKSATNDNITTALYTSFFGNISITGKLSAVTRLQAFALKIV